MSDTAKTWVWTVFKLGLAGATLWAVALGVLSLDPQKGDVSESTADIWNFTDFRESSNAKFARTLERLGHEPPRVYDNNGNTIFFSTRFTTKTPDELLHEYQHAFVAEGVNREMHLTPRDQAANASPEGQHQFVAETSMDMLTGEIVPFSKTPNYLMMGGGLLRGEPMKKEEVGRLMEQDREENAEMIAATLEEAYRICGGDPADVQRILAKMNEGEAGDIGECNGKGRCDPTHAETIERGKRALAVKEALMASDDEFRNCPALKEAAMQLNREAGFASKFKGYRSIEAFRDMQKGTTSVTAVWTDDDFDASKALAYKYGGESAEPKNFPMCRDCKATWNLAGNGREDGFGTTMMHSEDSLPMVEDFYRARLKEDGWEPVAGDQILEKIYDRVGNPIEGARSLRYQRGNETLRVLLAEDDERERTNITVTRSPN